MLVQHWTRPIHVTTPGKRNRKGSSAPEWSAKRENYIHIVQSSYQHPFSLVRWKYRNKEHWEHESPTRADAHPDSTWSTPTLSRYSVREYRRPREDIYSSTPDKRRRHIYRSFGQYNCDRSKTAREAEEKMATERKRSKRNDKQATNNTAGTEYTRYPCWGEGIGRRTSIRFVSCRTVSSRLLSLAVAPFRSPQSRWFLPHLCYSRFSCLDGSLVSRLFFILAPGARKSRMSLRRLCHKCFSLQSSNCVPQMFFSLSPTILLRCFRPG